ncbi:transcriptional regulator GlxA family with amidase domain [Paraburkholderia sp. Clong3]|uniref:helix-turn-helix domain-containing protein n=1 Tax=Paraburkholderia sp. Clong3 TaxID=2991061 RepID=UPI003D21962A
MLDHIYDHLDEPLDIGRLAEIACLSPYHWHRIYQAMYGETVATTVRRLRLHRAAGFLASSSMPIAQIAERSGYSKFAVFFADVSRGVWCTAGAVSQARHA